MSPLPTYSRIILLAAALAAGSPLATAAPFELRDGDRVVFVGSVFIERMQSYGYLETLITAAHPDKQITFRNIGWSGDTVWGESRGVFGTQAQGFARLVKEVKDTKPTVLVVCYGGNEAHAGVDGLPHFTEGINNLLDAVRETKARLVLLSPHRYEAGHENLPDPSRYNAALRSYCSAIEEVAKERQATYVSLHELVPSRRVITDASGRRPVKMTDNGLHLNQLGYWIAAKEIGETFDAAPGSIKIKLDMKTGEASAEGGHIIGVDSTDQTTSVTAVRNRLPLPPPKMREILEDLVELRNLPAGRYELRVDGEHAMTVAGGKAKMRIPWQTESQMKQVAELREAIRVKNELYFHRYRPQNETYLFLFRKHEQGNNAVEIPQFDPLIEKQEKLIAELKKPRQHVYEIVRVGDGAAQE